MSASPPQNERLADFEYALGQLEKIVDRLESGDLPLAEALKAYEEGIGLARGCQSALEEATLTVRKLSQPAGEL